MLQVYLLFEIDRIERFHDKAHAHVTHAEDDRHFHLNRVSKTDFLPAHEPNRINTKRIDTFLVHDFSSCLKAITRAEKVERNCHEIIIDESTVDSKTTHDKK